ncbi:phosphodiester glycosidase family protein [Ancylothrix sp. C2]|uniref:phosphodiester glycosidase family protein n=1 Tax=Ancylothrix sp. D3o TaxID=2953691 RepID=UPI0021BA401E|nr:phosphodiester glycosidase family protein [Ancylothrix sp. D3o]MCT7949736.1 phosphodiester glycosidase family protein [Ancylothrix sp. D3o]
MTNALSVFSDISNHPAAAFISALQSRGIVSGFPDGTFRPEQVMTRAQFAAILLKAFQRPKVRNYIDFIDVPASFWGAGAIQTAFESGFLSGFPNKRFLPQDNITRVQALVSLVAGLGIGSWVGADAGSLVLSDFYSDADQIPSYAKEPITIATFAKLVVNFSDIKVFNPNAGATRGEVAAFIYQALVCLGQAPAIVSSAIVELPKPKIIREGKSISINGKSGAGVWVQWGYGSSPRTGLSEVAAGQILGIELLSSGEVSKQPVGWFSDPTKPFVLPILLEKSLRFLDVTALLKANNLLVEVEGNTLKLITPPAAIDMINFEDLNPVSRITINFNRPTPIQVYQQNAEWVAVLEATAPQYILDQYRPRPIDPPDLSNPNVKPTGDKNEGETGAAKERPRQPFAFPSNNQITLRSNLPDGFGLKFFTVANPPRLIIELRPDALVEKQISWVSSLRWQQQYLRINTDRFPVYWLSVSLKDTELILRPIWADPNSMAGTTSLLQMAQKWQALAAINAGFFNRNNVLPLGAIRRDGKWLAGPNFNRGAIAWNDEGRVKISRLALQETVITENGQRYLSIALNSGFVKAGISRYTGEWGANYTPLLDDEIIISVVNNAVTAQTPGGTGTNKKPVVIPKDGYLLTLRAFASVAASFKVGSKVQLETATVPADFMEFPHILGAGPVLLQEGKVAIDAPAEQFSDAYVKQMAIRSCLGITPAGELLIAAIHNRVGGKGVTFAETAQLMLKLGATEALNLDGGSSTSLYLGGQLINRLPETAARVHNGLAVFRK